MRTPGWQPRERASTPSESSSQTQSSSIHISPLHRHLYRYFSFSSSFSSSSSSPFFLFSLDSALVWCPIPQPLKHPTLAARFAFSLFSKTPCSSRSRFSTARSSSRHHHRHHQCAKGDDDDDDDDASSGKPSFVLFFETTTTPTSRRPKPLRCGESKVALLLFSMWATKTMMIPTTTTTFSWVVVVVVVLARVRTCTAGNPPKSCSFYVKQQSKDTSKSSKRSLSFSLSCCVSYLGF